MQKSAPFVAALFATPAFAHPGHLAADASGAFHWLTQADHLAVIVCGVTLALLAGLPRGRALLRRVAVAVTFRRPD